MKGRPKRGESVTEIVREVLSEIDPETKRARREVIAEKLVKLAEDGNLRAVELLMERTEGKVAVKIEKEYDLVNMIPSQEVLDIFRPYAPEEKAKQ